MYHRKPEPGVHYHAFVDMSGGSHDDACLAIAYKDPNGRAVVACLVNQGQPPPFDPRKAVERFAGICHEYGVRSVVGDKYAGETFLHDFLRHHIAYDVSVLPANKMYEAIEASFNAREIMLLDHAELESQLLGLCWRGGKIDHPPSEHDDFCNATVGALLLALYDEPVNTEMTDDEREAIRRMFRSPGEIIGLPSADFAGNFLTGE